MTYISATCPYCTNKKSITSEKTKWLIHLASHRENIIRHITDETSSCIFCAYPEPFANKKHASSHYRWNHEKIILNNWALENMKGIMVA